GFTGLTDCDLGATAYSPSANDGRTIKVSFKESPAVAAWEDIQISKLNYVPMSLNSQQLAGFSATEFLKIEPGASQTPLTIAQVNTLLQIIAGTTTIFVKPGDTAAGDLSGTFAAPVVDGLQGVPVLATAPTPNQVLKFNGTAWAPATESMPGDASYAAKGAVQFLTDQATSGIQVAAGVASLPSLFAQGSSVGGAQQIPVITYDTKGRLTALAAAAVDDTTKLPLDGSDPMTGSLNMGNQNITNVNSVSTTSIGSRSLRLFDADNSNYVDLQTPSVVATNYALTLPADDGTAGQVLTTDGNGVLSWAANGSGITVDPNEAVIANATGTGLVSFFCPMNQVFSFDGMGIPTCQAVTPAGGFINNGNSFAANATLGLNDGFDLNIETSGVPRMTLTAAGNVGIGTTSPAGLFIVNGGTAAPASNGLGISLAAQNAGSGNQSGGSINLNTGSSTGTGSPGAIYLNPGSDSGLNPGIIMATGNLIVAPTNYRSGVDNSNLVTLNIQGLVNSSVTTYTGTFTSMYSFPRVAPSPGRTFNEVIGLYSRIGHIGFGNTTNFYNIYSANPSISTGTVQNAYGLYVEPITSGTTSNYSIYANGASPSYFGGNVGIGVTTPTRPLHVNGPMRITASTLPGTPAAGDIAVDSGDANKLKYYDGSAWQTAGGSGGGALPAAGGTAAAPGYAFTGDTNTGMFSSIADTVQFSTNSTERMRIDSSGNVCVGTSSPSGTLDVHKTSATSADSAVLAISHDDSSFVNYARTHLRLFTLRSNLNSSNFDGSTNKGWELTANSMSGGAGGSLGNLTLHWQGSGAWGVATETKATHMEVSPNGRFTFGAENAGTWTDSTVNVAGNLSVGQNYYTQPAPINGAIFEGNVGIGTASPVTKLDVNGEVKGNSFYSVGDISTDATLWAGGAILNGGGTAATPALVVGDGDGQAGIYGGASTLGLSTSGLSRIHITHTGNVGIGTT
ncbi:MAG: beta strand repeat-containing protein, partial [Bdellovibrionales bacterium]